MMGYNSSDNGGWNGIWFLGQGNGSRELDLQETGICGQSPAVLCSHIQAPASNVADYNSGQDLSAGYHIYGIDYNGNTGVTNFYLDNKLEGSVTQATGTGPYYLLLDGDLGNGFAGANPPASKVDMKMNIMQVQVYQR
jgi:beta-glucanase (GH16 family)